MIQNGTRPTPIDRRDDSFHRTFGAITLPNFPDFYSIDANFGFPDQNAIGLQLGCTGVTSNELCTDQDLINYDDYEYTYRKTLELEGVYTLNTQGCDIRDALKIVTTLGPRTKAVGDVDGEAKARSRYYAIENHSDWFDSFRSTILTNFLVNNMRCAISIGTPWFREFDIMHVGPDGIVPEVFTGDVDTMAWHNWAIKGWKTINGVPYLLGKTWQGPNVGSGGWYYFSRKTINEVMKIRGTAAFTVAPKVENAQKIEISKVTILIELITRFIQNLFTLEKKQEEIKPPVVLPPNPTPMTNMILKWATLIAKKEGAKPELNNPGNFKYTPMLATWGAQKSGAAGSDGGYFCKFPTYAMGFQALVNFLTMGCHNELRPYHNARTIKEFTLVYTNHPKPKFDYSDSLIAELGVTADTDISTFLT